MLYTEMTLKAESEFIVGGNATDLDQATHEGTNYLTVPWDITHTAYANLLVGYTQRSEGEASLEGYFRVPT